MGGGDEATVAALLAGDEAAFARLVTEWSGSMRLLARGFVSTDASADEVVQDTWLAVVRGLDGFEGRSALRTWVYGILVNLARTRGVRESRCAPFSSLGPEDVGPSVAPDRFQGAGEQYPGGWRSFPVDWRSSEDLVLDAEVRARLHGALERLPPRQRVVMTLRDVVGCSSQEVCDLLEVSPGNQRVLLHRARSLVREELATYLAVPPEGDGR